MIKVPHHARWVRVVAFTLMELWAKEAGKSLSPNAVSRVERGLVEKLAHLPFYMKAAFTVLTIQGWFSCLVRFLTVNNLTLEQRHALLLNAKTSKIGPICDFYLFTEKLTILYLLDEAGQDEV